VRERIKINNEPISEELFATCFWEIWDRLEATKPTQDSPDSRSRDGKPVYFHYLTLMALHCFLKEKVGSAVVECGIGGEYDTTNILVRPTVTGVTSLGIDHESLLGDTIESIAWHKAGIFKEDVPAFTVPQPETALQVMHDRAKEKHTGLHIVTQHAALNDIKLGLQGEFQKINASLAIAVSAQHLQRLGYNGIPSPLDNASQLPQEFKTGLESARLGGRCDMRPDTKIEGLTWYIDGGHTLESIEVAGRWFVDTVSTPSLSVADTTTTRVLIFNQQTRDASNLAKRLHSTLASALNDPHPFKNAIFCPNITYKDAGYKADLVSINTNKHDIDSLKVQRELANTWDRIDPDSEVHVVGTIEEAIKRARELAESVDGAVDVMVTGSLHLVGGLIEVLESEVERARL
jgi:folylpolyglutamate synthase